MYESRGRSLVFTRPICIVMSAINYAHHSALFSAHVATILVVTLFAVAIVVAFAVWFDCRNRRQVSISFNSSVTYYLLCYVMLLLAFGSFRRHFVDCCPEVAVLLRQNVVMCVVGVLL